MTKSRSLLDLLPEDERKKAIERGQRRMQAQRAKGPDVSPEIYLVSKAGSYWGWEAMMAIRRGYTIEPVLDSRGNLAKDEDGNLSYTANTLTLDEVALLLEGADKFRMSQLIEKVHGGIVSGSFKSSSKTFEQAVKPFVDKAKVQE